MGRRIPISIHAAREGGDGEKIDLYAQLRISIHAAREGGDVCIYYIMKQCLVFQSTPPVKAATPNQMWHGRMYAISIHAAREGGDGCLCQRPCK